MPKKKKAGVPVAVSLVQFVNPDIENSYLLSSVAKAFPSSAQVGDVSHSALVLPIEIISRRICPSWFSSSQLRIVSPIETPQKRKAVLSN